MISLFISPLHDPVSRVAFSNGFYGISSFFFRAEARYRDPTLPETVEFLSHPNPNIQANAAAYLQHLCFMDDDVKTETRMLGGIPALVALVSSQIPEVHRAACGAMRNLSYGRKNDENKVRALS